jgi:AcrR family transcriptional regulator
MTKASETDRTDAALTAPTRWETRSGNRVLESSREQILKRSRQIVEAAYELLDKEGLEGLTIRAVLSKTGLSRRAFYERFADKDDLVLAVFEESIRAAARFYRTELNALPNPMDRLRMIITNIALANKTLDGMDSELEGSRRGAALSREHLRLAESRASDLQAALAPLIGLIAEQLADGMAAGAVRQTDPQQLATLVYNLVSTTVHTALLAEESAHSDRVQRIQLADRIWEFCYGGIAS